MAGWHVRHPETATILEGLCSNSIPLINYVGQIYSGIKTGNKNAYFISYSEAERLSRDKRIKQFIKPLLRPVTIRKWRANWDGTHLILIKKGQTVPGESELMQHLRSHELALRSRSDIQGHATWYGLRECSYYEIFCRPKIIFPDIASDCRFAMDSDNYFIPDGAFILPIEDYTLLGILNSCVGRAYFRARCNTIGNPLDGGRLRFKKTYVEEFPVSRLIYKESRLCIKIQELVRECINGQPDDNVTALIDELVLDLLPYQCNSKVLFLENN